MYTGQYRIVQVADNLFIVEELCRIRIPRYGFFGFGKTRWVEEWNRVGAGGRPTPPLLSEAQAQKWIDDKRKYPIVVKQPA